MPCSGPPHATPRPCRRSPTSCPWATSCGSRGCRCAARPPGCPASVTGRRRPGGRATRCPSRGRSSGPAPAPPPALCTHTGVAQRRAGPVGLTPGTSLHLTTPRLCREPPRDPGGGHQSLRYLQGNMPELGLRGQNSESCKRGKVRHVGRSRGNHIDASANAGPLHQGP